MTTIADIAAEAGPIVEGVTAAVPIGVQLATALEAAKTTQDRVAALETFTTSLSNFLVWMFPQHAVPVPPAPATAPPAAPAA